MDPMSQTVLKTGRGQGGQGAREREDRGQVEQWAVGRGQGAGGRGIRMS